MKLNPEHKPKYVYLLAYATSVSESALTTGKKTGSGRRNINKEELKATALAIDKVHNICNTTKGSTELIAELSTIYHCIKLVTDLTFISLCIYIFLYYSVKYFTYLKSW